MAFTLVNTNKGGTSGASSFTVSCATTTTGNAMIVVVGAGGTNWPSSSPLVSSITDSQSNVYTQATMVDQINASDDCEIWYAANITGGTTPTITIHFAQSFQGAAIAQEWSGVATSSPLDKAVSAFGSGAGASSGATATTTNANELVIGGLMSSSTNVPTVGTGYSNLQTETVSGMTCIAAIESKTVSSTGAQTATFGNTPSSWSVCVATFLPAAAAAFVSSPNKPVLQAIKRASFR